LDAIYRIQNHTSISTAAVSV